jgi:FdhD protein
MQSPEDLGAVFEVKATRYARGSHLEVALAVPTEVPLTVNANGLEVATLLCTPTDLEAMACGFLFSAGLIHGGRELLSCQVDPTRWVADCQLARTPDLELLDKRVYTTGCGKGVMYANVVELSSRRPLQSPLSVTPQQIDGIAVALQGASPHYRRTRGVHTSALGLGGEVPERWFDDVGRHNAVDKAIGDGLLRGVDFQRCVLISSGRTSSEILQKCRLAGIPVCVSRSVPTHQSVLRALDMGVTLVGQARRGEFVVYSHGDRVAAAPENP